MRHSVIPVAPLSQEIQFSLKRSEFTLSDEVSIGSQNWAPTHVWNGPIGKALCEI